MLFGTAQINSGVLNQHNIYIEFNSIKMAHLGVCWLQRSHCSADNMVESSG